MEIVRYIAGLLVPPLCAACGGPCASAEVICGGCAERLRAAQHPHGDPPPGIESIHSAAPHDGVARDLVVALKFHRLLPVAGLLAGGILDSFPGPLPPAVIVPVPAAPRRLRSRGFDPAEEIAAALAAAAGRPMLRCLARGGGPRQVGRPRRLRVGDPPRVSAISQWPRRGR